MSPGKFSAIVSIVGSAPKTPDEYREIFREHEELVHVTVETHVHPALETAKP